ERVARELHEVKLDVDRGGDDVVRQRFEREEQDDPLAGLDHASRTLRRAEPYRHLVEAQRVEHLLREEWGAGLVEELNAPFGERDVRALIDEVELEVEQVLEREVLDQWAWVVARLGMGADRDETRSGGDAGAEREQRGSGQQCGGDRPRFPGECAALPGHGSPSRRCGDPKVPRYPPRKTREGLVCAWRESVRPEPARSLGTTRAGGQRISGWVDPGLSAGVPLPHQEVSPIDIAVGVEVRSRWVRVD